MVLLQRCMLFIKVQILMSPKKFLVRLTQLVECTIEAGAVISSNLISDNGYAGIGRQALFRPGWLNPCKFKSYYPYIK
jgi:hypothetical protein